jgi:hypothetical protein
MQLFIFDSVIAFVAAGNNNIDLSLLQNLQIISTIVGIVGGGGAFGFLYTFQKWS